MKLYYIGIIRNKPQGNPVHELIAVKNLSSWGYFERTPAGEFMTVFAKGVAEGTVPLGRDETQRQVVQQQQQDSVFYAYGRKEGICGIVITDSQYPALAAHTLVTNAVHDFLVAHKEETWKNGTPTLQMPKFQEYLTECQDPQKTSSILKIQQELDETKIVLHETIEKVLQRGEKIDDLVAKSEDLSMSSRAFYQGAKKQNSCCVLM
ncbi:v-snare-like protein [Mariannaea sp. PMI_226]|nr:v-snare-like protein [Mariannaea sp. PMI_226]